MTIKKRTQFTGLSIRVFGFILLSSFINAQAQLAIEEKISSIEASYLKPRNALIDYILDTGDTINIDIASAPELSGTYTIDAQGEIYIKKIKYIYIRGLTIKDLTKLLEKRYEEILINPDIYITIATFKPIKVFIKGEVRSPGLVKFPAYISENIDTILNPIEIPKKIDKDESIVKSSIKRSKFLGLVNSEKIEGSQSFSTKKLKNKSKLKIERKTDYVSTLSNAIKSAGGLTSLSDISNIEIVREIPIGKGGGKKRAIVDFLYYANNPDLKNDFRLFNGDSIYIPALKEQNPEIVSNSIFSGLSPKFIDVDVQGQIENPGIVTIPFEGSLSDVMGLTGPRKPLSGKVFLIRYDKDGTLKRENIKYSATATPGSRNNPFLFDGDLITVKNSILGRTSGTLKAVTEPFVGIYSTKELIENITGN